MAISDDRLDLSNITKVVKENYNSINESAGPGPSLVAKNDAVIAKGVFDPIVSTGNAPLDEAIGFTRDLLCKGLPPLNLRLPSYKLSLPRELNLNLGLDISIDPCLGAKDPMDSILGSSYVDDLRKTIVPYGADDMLDKLLNSQMKDLLDGLGIFKDIAGCLVFPIKGELLNLSGFKGLSLKSKLNLSGLLNMKLDLNLCGSNNTAKPNVNKTLKALTVSAIINKLVGSDVDSLLKFVDSGLTNNKMSRVELLEGFKYSFLTETCCKNITTKLGIVKNVLDIAGSTAESNSEAIVLNDMSNIIISKLGNASIAGSSPVSSYVNIVDALDVINPNWISNNDNVADITNVLESSNLLDLGSVVLKSKTPQVDLSTSVRDTVLNTATVLAIGNSFKVSNDASDIIPGIASFSSSFGTANDVVNVISGIDNIFNSGSNKKTSSKKTTSEIIGIKQPCSM